MLTERENILIKNLVDEYISTGEAISSEKILIKDQNLIIYSFENSNLNLKDNEVAGKDVKVDFVDNFVGK